MKVSKQANVYKGDGKKHETLHRRPASLIVKRGDGDTHGMIQTDIDIKHDNPVYEIPGYEYRTNRIGSTTSNASSNVNNDGRHESIHIGDAERGGKRMGRNHAGSDSSVARHSASAHMRRFGYAAFTCCIVWMACSAMGADFGIVNQSSGIMASAFAVAIVGSHIVTKISKR